MSPAKKRFAVASGLPPSAEEAVAVTAPERQGVVTSAKRPNEAPRRSAFTWRLTTEQAVTLDLMIARVKRELGRPKVDRAQLLAALVAVADRNPAIFAAVVAEMQEQQTS